MFSAGDKIVYPMHGAGIICGIEEKKILGEKKEYYIFKLPCSEINLMIPVESEATVGIRPVAEREVISDVTELRSAESSCMDSNWNRRYREIMEKLKSGDLTEVARVVKALMHRDARRGLSTGERKMLRSAKQILLSEIALVQQMAYDAAERWIDEVMMTGAVNDGKTV